MQPHSNLTGIFSTFLALSSIVIRSEALGNMPLPHLSISDFGIFIPDIIFKETQTKETLAKANFPSITLITDYSLFGSATASSLHYPRMDYSLFNAYLNVIESTGEELFRIMSGNPDCHKEPRNIQTLSALNNWQGKACDSADSLVMLCQPGREGSRCRMAPDSLLFSTENNPAPHETSPYIYSSNTTMLQPAETASKERHSLFQTNCLFMFFSANQFTLARTLHLSNGVSENYIKCYTDHRVYGQQTIVAFGFSDDVDWQTGIGVITGKAIEFIKILCPKGDSSGTCQPVDGNGNGDNGSQSSSGDEGGGNDQGANHVDSTGEVGGFRGSASGSSSGRRRRDDDENERSRNNRKGDQSSASKRAENQITRKIGRGQINWLINWIQYLLRAGSPWASTIIDHLVQLLTEQNAELPSESDDVISILITYLENVIGESNIEISTEHLLGAAFTMLSQARLIELFDHAASFYSARDLYEDSELAQRSSTPSASRRKKRQSETAGEETTPLTSEGHTSPTTEISTSPASRQERRQSEAESEEITPPPSEGHTNPMVGITPGPKRNLFLRGVRKVAKKVNKLTEKKMREVATGENVKGTKLIRKVQRLSSFIEENSRKPDDNSEAAAPQRGSDSVEQEHLYDDPAELLRISRGAAVVSNPLAQGGAGCEVDPVTSTQLVEAYAIVSLSHFSEANAGSNTPNPMLFQTPGSTFDGLHGMELIPPPASTEILD